MVSLLTQEGTKKSPVTYIYFLLGGLISVLMLFLIRQSLPFNRQQAKEYHQNIQKIKQEVFSLEGAVLQSIQQNYQIDNEELELQLNTIEENIKNLEKIPTFVSKQEQLILMSKLETHEVLLNSQVNLVQEVKDINLGLSDSCHYIYKFRSNFLNNFPQSAIDLKILEGNLLQNTSLYCYNNVSDSRLSIEDEIKKLEGLLQNEAFKKYNLWIISLVEHAENILLNQRDIDRIDRQFKESSLREKLLDFENTYLDSIDSLDSRINRYRLVSYLLLLVIVIVIASQVINKLTKTNRNIVKVLESFTQELETKVEQRTALLEESIQNTEAALAQAQNANKAKSRFLANMSHELRTPLNAILGFTQLMCRDSSVSKENQENIQIINRSGEHLLKLINDILEMSKIEVGQITLNEVKFDLYVMLKSIEEMLHLKAKAKNLNLSFHIAKNVPQYIYTDEGKLRQIVINLLGNALKFTQKGAIALKVELRDDAQLEETNIDFLFTDTRILRFKVEDTGPGIPAEEMDGLFSPFEQTKIGRVSNEGTGLGLSICQKFVELMGGKLEVESTVGKGSTFSFGISVKLEDIAVSSSLEANEFDDTRRAIAIADSQEKYRILAVDDVPASRLLLRKLLTEIGFVVEEAGDGQQAVNLFSSWHPHLILMDMRMPVMDGYEATKQIKSLPNGKETIIIALTASAFEEERVVILSVGCDDFMRKPFYEKELLEKIGQYLNIDYVYEETTNVAFPESDTLVELHHENLDVMPLKWRSQLYDAAARVDNQEILQLLSDIPQEYESLAKGLENLVEHFRCDKIIDLTKPAN